jgi:hypothetical protein
MGLCQTERDRFLTRHNLWNDPFDEFPGSELDYRSNGECGAGCEGGGDAGPAGTSEFIPHDELVEEIPLRMKVSSGPE